MTLRELTTYPKRIPELYGTLISITLIIYFFIVYLTGYVYVTELRVLNLLIQVAGIYFAVKQFRRTHAGHIDYFRSLVIGVSTSFIASSTFALFLFIFLQLDQNLMTTIQENAPLGEYLNPYIASFSVLLEGVFSGFLATFIIINYIKTDNA